MFEQLNVSYHHFIQCSSFTERVSFIDGIGGEILMHCLKKCVGPDVYTFAVHYAFTKFFSRMLDVIVPLVIQQELNGTLGGTNMSASESRPSSPTNTNTTEVEGYNRAMMAR